MREEENEIIVSSDKIIDLFMFMGQSNMAGRGTVAEAPIVKEGRGYEYRAISDPTKLYDIVEPFGVMENNTQGINEPNAKTGSLVSAFVNSYYDMVKVPIVGVSASKGGTSIARWQPKRKLLTDAIERLSSSVKWLENNSYKIRHKYMLWCQGESDGDKGTTIEEYKELFLKMSNEMFKVGIEKIFLIEIGNNRDDEELYYNIQQAQKDICEGNKDIVLVSSLLKTFSKGGLMKDRFHYKQEGYNIVGKEAGINTAVYVNSLYRR